MKINHFLAGIGLGVGLMYFLDPDRGNRRRGLMRDKLFGMERRFQRAAQGKARDLGNRARGMWAETMAQFCENGVADDVVEARVRSAMGRHVPNAKAVKVEVRDGSVTLSGEMDDERCAELENALRRVRGVNDVHFAT